MNEQEIISAIAQEVRAKMEGESSGHDWWHVYRVWRMVKRIGAEEKAEMFAVELAALLHDIADWKFHDGDDTVGPRVAREMLERHNVPEEVIARVCSIISEVSFKGAGASEGPSTLAGMVVQDADRLDALGAIGIARAFAYGGHKNRVMHDPAMLPATHRTKEEYRKNQSTAVNHFYEKLLLLRDRLNTPTARAIAEDRHAFLEAFLARFLEEWEG